ncbi:hypothetical protein IQ219_10945 [Synechocystis sp. LEGE 06083]|uniref:hypothetical protein n=1 Tax=Synechocystis sp. LEGE 06083 TaxID=915336 RepID=UPI00187F2AE8|nr:hypothetical protein [Synechocystis sp. LEGE 06083]MBE9195807.1 hypothetical protein [Synechocystis sp. LEGE 06083]
MSPTNDHEEVLIREVYDFSGGERGKHYQAYRKGTNIVLLDPDVAAIFKDSATVNLALRKLAAVEPDFVDSIR